MLNEIETFFLVAKPELSFLSSSAAKTIAKFGGDITGFIPEAIEKEIKETIKTDKTNLSYIELHKIIINNNVFLAFTFLNNK